MKLISALFSKSSRDKLKLQFIKHENTWYVLRDGHILYIGDKDKCQKYMEYARA